MRTEKDNESQLKQGTATPRAEERRLLSGIVLVGIVLSAILTFSMGYFFGMSSTSETARARFGPAARREIAAAVLSRYRKVDGTRVRRSPEFELWSNDKIDYVDLTDTAIQDNDIELLENTEGITELYLRNTSITDKSLTALATLPDLQLIDVQHTNVTKEGVNAFMKRRSDCQVIANASKMPAEQR